MKNLFILVLLGIAIPFSSCDKENQADIDDQLILDYLADNSLNGLVTDSGLYYVIDSPGSGGHPTISSNVTIDYRGTLLNGLEFDSSYSRGEPLEINLSNTILGWQEGIPLFQRGGSGQLIIPSGLGYGNQGVGPIPPNSVLVFDIELIDFE